jgi:hypothetical protein
MKAFNLIFCLLFIVSAALQYNDPDPYVWIPLYLYAAALCWLTVRQKFYPDAYLIGIVLYIIYAIYLFFTEDGVLDWMQQHDAENIAETMKATKPWIEDTREFFGLLIMAAVMTIDFFYAKKQLRLKARIFE